MFPLLCLEFVFLAREKIELWIYTWIPCRLPACSFIHIESDLKRRRDSNNNNKKYVLYTRYLPAECTKKRLFQLFTAQEHIFKRWFCSQLPVWNVCFKDFWYAKKSESKIYIKINLFLYITNKQFMFYFN